MAVYCCFRLQGTSSIGWAAVERAQAVTVERKLKSEDLSLSRGVDTEEKRQGCINGVPRGKREGHSHLSISKSRLVRSSEEDESTSDSDMIQMVFASPQSAG